MLTLYLLFAPRNIQASEAVADGIRRAFEKVEIRSVGSVDEVLLNPAEAGKSIVVLIQPDMGEIELAVKASTEGCHARWPVVSLSGDVKSTGLAVIPPEDWNAPLLAQVFRMTLQQQELIAENARLRGDLLTVARRISHDLRTPLSGVFTTAELLNEILAETSEEDAALTAPLFDSAQAMLKLIERVSQVARASVDARPKEAVSMGAVVWTARQAAERAAIKQGVKITEPDEWPPVAGVPPWLEIIWENLLTNAVRYGGKGGLVEIQWRELPGAFEFSVLDHGVSVPEDKRSHLFHPFEKLHESHSARGLGLSITRRLVELQNGSCGYDAVAGGGSRFFFTLPKVQPVSETVS